MEIGNRYARDVPQKNGRNYVNPNEFTPVEGKRSENELIREFVKQKDVAPWFRGTSHFHIQGADRLFNALRDDGEQNTTHRVRNCLNLIGLTPMITSKQIKFLMHLSRGNDLVFLWFLMEMHYKTPKHNPNSYSLNEQLICSAICHLDMITTLRELDKILPCGHTPRLEMKKSELKRQDTKESFTKHKNKKGSHEFVLPYFKKYCRPEHYGKQLFLNEPNFKVSFGMYSRYSNPNHTVQNESNRWYTDYSFNPGKCIVHSIIRDTIENIFYNYRAVSWRLNNIAVLCDYHKTLKTIAANMEHELKVKARNECLKQCFKSNEIGDEDHANKIKELLHKDIQRELCKLYDERTVRNDESLKIISSDCNIIDVILESNACYKPNTNTINKTADRKIETEASTDIPRKQHEICCVLHGNVQGSTLNVENKKSSTYYQNGWDFKEIENNPKLHTDKFNEENKLNKSCNFCNVPEALHTSESLFKRPTNNKPFKFDYKKIFATDYKDDEKARIRKMFLAALEEDISCLSTKIEQPDHNYDDAVQRCTQAIFDNEMKKYETEMVDDIDLNRSESLNAISQYPPFANYNPQDYRLMTQMLSDAFQYLRKNPKFVWAQLPDAHKVPFLREWTARRFGKEYTPTERLNSYENSCLIFRALDKSDFRLSVPNATHIGRNVLLNYDCRKHVDKKVKHIKNEYYHRLDSSYLEHTRVFWFAMRGYICSNGPPRKSFFAYMPSRLQDIHHFRLWRSTEYRNYKDVWNVRRHKKNREHF